MGADMDEQTILDVLTGNVDIHNAIQSVDTGDIISANLSLDFADTEL